MIEFTPILGIQAGPFIINMHGIMTVIGVAIGYYLFEKATKGKISKNIREKLLVIAVISGLVGARLFYVAAHLEEFAVNPLDIFKIWEGGISLLGGLIVGALAIYIYTKKGNLDFFAITDSVVLPVAIGQFVGRIGDVLTWDHPGTDSTALWAFVVEGRSQHPVILYEMLGILAIIFILHLISKRNLFERNRMFVYLGLYGLLRLVNDTFRQEPLYFGLEFGQILGSGLIIFSLISILCLRFAIKRQSQGTVVK